MEVNHLRHWSTRVFRQARAVEEAVEVLFHGEDLEVAGRAGVVHAVAEETDAVVHGDDHVFDGAELAVVVAEVFHGWMRFLSGPPGSGVKVD